MAAPSALQIYAEALNLWKLSELASAAVYLMLVGSGYTPDTDDVGHSILADIGANEIANGNGYTTGGVALTGLSVAPVNSPGPGFKFSSGNAAWTASGSGIIAWRYGVLYVNTNPFWTLNKPLLAVFTGDSAPADVPPTAAGNSLQITCPAGGWFTLTRT